MERGGVPMEREELRRELSDMDEAVLFLIVIIAGVLLSFRATLLQREGLRAAYCGQTADTTEIYPLRHTANALLVGALGFFLCLSAKHDLRADKTASPAANLTAAAMVLTAAVIRFRSTETTAASQG